MEGEHILRALRYSVFPLLAFGTSPITLRHVESHIFYKISLIGVIYVIALLGLLACSGYYCYEVLPDVFEHHELPMLRIHAQIRSLWGPVCCIIILLSSVMTAPAACRVTAGFFEFFTVLPHHFKSRHYRYTVFCSAALVVFLFLIITLALYFEISNLELIPNNELTFFDHMTFFISWMSFDIITWATLCQLLVFTSILNFQFRALEIEVADGLQIQSFRGSVRKTIRVVAKDSLDFGLPKNLRQLRHLHIHLTCVAEDLNTLFATRILFLITLDTVLLCFSLYILILNLDHVTYAPPLGDAVPGLLIRIVPITIAIYPFCCIRAKVHRISTVVHQWITKVDDERIIEQLLLFASQLKTRKLRFSAHDFFSFEMSTIAMIAGSALSYLVILIQFHVMFKKITHDDISWLSSEKGQGIGFNFSYQFQENVTGNY